MPSLWRHLCSNKLVSQIPRFEKKLVTDRRRDGRTDGGTDGPTKGQTLDASKNGTV